MTLTAAELAGGLLEKGAVRLAPTEPFTWSSGMKAPIYCDNRQLLGDAGLRARIADALAEGAKVLSPTLIAGTSTAGIPWGALVADRLALPFAYVRPEPKKHGMGRQVEGPTAKGHRVVLIEDLISTGGSSLKCVEALRAEGGEVAAVMALFSYGLPSGVAAFGAAKCPLQVLATFETMVAEARGRGTVDAAGADSLKAWQADAGSWSRSHGGA
ncbi:MAG: orotate phosphoribosyltransferase [Acidobacteria bacterium]|nr:orotate phosphoribosyltransferase [Acidobacteriota bacterium]